MADPVMALYLDTSCLLKAFFLEPETAATVNLIARESQVIVSSLTRLEALVHIHGRVAAKMLSTTAARRLIGRLDQVLQEEPYELVACPAGIIEIAETQVRAVAKSAYCRTLDRLHLATMQVLAVHRLLTNDDAQARAARGLGFEIVRPS